MTLTLKANAKASRFTRHTESLGFYEEHLSETEIAPILLVNFLSVIYMELVGRLLASYKEIVAKNKV